MTFANHRVGGKPDDKSRRYDTSISLESWHDFIHGLVGTGDGNAGHMADPSIASVSFSLLYTSSLGTDADPSSTRYSGYITSIPHLAFCAYI